MAESHSSKRNGATAQPQPLVTGEHGFGPEHPDLAHRYFTVNPNIPMYNAVSHLGAIIATCEDLALDIGMGHPESAESAGFALYYLLQMAHGLCSSIEVDVPSRESVVMEVAND